MAIVVNTFIKEYLLKFVDSQSHPYFKKKEASGYLKILNPCITKHKTH